ncbi:MAG: hypothetical protein P4L40_16935 [Terracidiphilus sp.]|nr:hypothetical protein [Terracidiphilus sp.]
MCTWMCVCLCVLFLCACLLTVPLEIFTHVCVCMQVYASVGDAAAAGVALARVEGDDDHPGIPYDVWYAITTFTPSSPPPSTYDEPAYCKC